VGPAAPGASAKAPAGRAAKPAAGAPPPPPPPPPLPPDGGVGGAGVEAEGGDHADGGAGGSGGGDGAPAEAPPGEDAKQRRNEHCKCGSGKRYRKCCEPVDRAMASRQARLKAAADCPGPTVAATPSAKVDELVASLGGLSISI
jgi:hypothetical protein